MSSPTFVLLVLAAVVLGLVAAVAVEMWVHARRDAKLNALYEASHAKAPDRDVAVRRLRP